MIERELIPKFKSMVLTLRNLKQFTGEEWAYAHQLIWANNISELINKFGNYLFDEKALSLAIYAKADKVVYWLLEHGMKATYQHLKEAAIQGSIHLFDFLINAGADLHYNNDEILFYISGFYDKPYHPRTQKELPLIINKYKLQKTNNNCGF
jgi:hypothetical protein